MEKTAIRNAIMGMAAGDSLAWTGIDQREFLMPPRRIPSLRKLDSFADATNSTTRPRPYAHSSPPKLLGPYPSDDLEWFAFSAQGLLASVRERSENAVIDRWRAVSTQKVRARTGTKIALLNLRRGMSPPQSGHDNPHYFDDIACIRAVAAGLIAGPDPTEAVRLASLDAAVTHALDGVWCARATAALVATLGHGSGTVSEAIDHALAELPANSWSRRLAAEALLHADAANDNLDLAYRLTERLTDKIYSYAVAAPETFALAIAHLAISNSPTSLMLGAFAHGRNGDSLPALIGALAGLKFGTTWVPHSMLSADLHLDGICLPQLAGARIQDLIDDLNTEARA